MFKSISLHCLQYLFSVQQDDWEDNDSNRAENLDNCEDGE